MIRYRSFHSSSRWLQRPEHPLYKGIDWSRIDAGHYAVEDPLDPHAILYLSEKAYQVQIRVSLSQDSSLIKLAGPGDSPVTSSTTSQANNDPDPTQKSPIPISKGSTKLWKKFLSWHLSALGRLGQKTNAKVKKDQGSKSPSRSGSQVGKASIDLSAAVLRTLIPYFGLDVHFRLGGDLSPSPELVSSLRELADRMVCILEGSGPQYLILYLKNTLFYLNKYAAGSACHSRLLDPPVSLARSGIPRLIPLLLRRRLQNKSKDLFAYRLVNTLLNSFRAMEGSHELQEFNSIRDPHPVLSEKHLDSFKKFCKETFWPKVVAGYMPQAKMDLLRNPEEHFRIKSDDGVYIPVKAGPNANPGLLGAQVDAYLWDKRSRVGLPNYIAKWCLHIGDIRTPEVFKQCLGPDSILYDTEYYSNFSHETTLSKIVCLPEPAGKVRTIAIVDYWTQRLMSPVHDWMMEILSHLPTDGTFRQEEATEQVARRFRITREHAYSIDLKSATDLIPIELYEAVFNGIWRADTVSLWKNLLTDRWFLIPPKEKLAAVHLRGCSIRYGRGQPMGTLSSWPSMALVHHALELYAAQRAGKDPCTFVDYAILGDDNVTLGTDVANAYVAVAEELCVPTSPAKTLDGNLFIFAQQIFLDGENISPLSLREELGIRTFSERLELALRATRRGWLDSSLTVPRFLRLLLSRGAYARAHREWSVGRLGKIAQSALFSAFGIASTHLSDVLGYQGSGFKTLLAALRGKIDALAGEQSRPAPSTKLSTRASRKALAFRKFERYMCISLAKALLERLKAQITDLELAAIRFRMWGETIRDAGVMPFFTIIPSRGKGNRAPELPGIPMPDSKWQPNLTPLDREAKDRFLQHMKPGEAPGTYTWTLPPPETKGVTLFKRRKTYSFNGKKFFRTVDEILPGEVFEVHTQRAHVGLWAVIYDSYKELFGSIREVERSPTGQLAIDLGILPLEGVEESYQDYEAEEEEYGGMGVTYSPSPNTVTSPITGKSTFKPRIVNEVRDARRKVEEILTSLTREDSPAPWLELHEAADILVKVSRCPRFVRWDDLLSLEAPATDPLKAMVRLGKTLVKVLPHITHNVAGMQPLVEADLVPVEEFPDYGFDNLPRNIPDPMTLIQAKTNQGLLTG